MVVVKPSGQLGDPSINIATDPRTNAEMLKAINVFGMGQKMPSPELTRSAPRADLLNYLKATHEGFNVMYDSIDFFRLPDDDEKRRVTVEEKTIKGGAGQDMKLFITRPEGATGKDLPCVIYYHGGGMVFIVTDNPIHRFWCQDIATTGQGAVVVMPDFRNAYDDVKHELRAFPAGLDDCVAAAEWVHAHRAELGVSSVVAQGESGGGNLALATALRLAEEGKRDVLDGVYALCPYISGMYGASDETLAAELPSLLEFDGYFLTRGAMDLCAWGYDPEEKLATNPQAWPYHATDEQLKLMPPMTIVVDEVDPLGSEGKRFAQRAIKAGVRCVAKQNLGTIHHGSGIFRNQLRDMRLSTCSDIDRFARSLRSG